MICPDCKAEMLLHHSEDDWKPDWFEGANYDYWLCHECWYSEDVE